MRTPSIRYVDLMKCIFQAHWRDGYANLETEAAFQDDAKTCRKFNPQIKVKDKFHYAFSVEVGPCSMIQLRLRNFCSEIFILK